MNTIAISISAALTILRNSYVPEWIKEDVQDAVEKLFDSTPVAVMGNTATLTLNSVCAPDVNKIKCIAAVRNTLRWGLKESKEWVEIVIGKADYSKGYYDDNNKWIPSITYSGGRPASLISTKDNVLELERIFRSLKCDVVVSSR